MEIDFTSFTASRPVGGNVQLFTSSDRAPADLRRAEFRENPCPHPRSNPHQRGVSR